jgi:KDO2-lipid IV(A) lauroyltransferase
MKRESAATEAGAWWRQPRHWPLAVVLGLLLPLAQLPMGWWLAAAQPAAWLLKPLAHRRRRIIRANIDLAFPELERATRAALAEQNFRDTVMGLFEGVVALFRWRRLREQWLRIEGLEHLDRALAAGRGVLIVGGHYTSMLLCGRFLAEAAGVPVPQLVRRHNNPVLEAFIDWGRRRHALHTIEKKDIATLLRLLRAGHPVALAADQDFNFHCAFVPFFAQPAATLKILPRLQRLSQAPKLRLAIRRGPGLIEWTLTLAPAEPPSGDDIADTAADAAWLEAQIRLAPTEYLWAHRRYKTRPPGMAPAYPAALRKRRAPESIDG